MKKLTILTILFLSLAGTFANAQSIAVGFTHCLSICTDQTIRAWGSNGDGQLGNGTNTGSNVPVQVSGLTGVIAVAAAVGGSHSLALKNNGTVWAWGWNVNGQLGNGTNISSNVPVQVSGLTGIIAIEGGSRHSLALKNDGTVWAWGDNLEGQLGNGTNTNSNMPVQVSGLTSVVAIAAGGYHNLALKSDGTLWIWGWNIYGQLGNGTNTDSNVPIQISGIPGIANIAAGSFQSLVLKTDGTVRSWGRNDYGQIGNGTNTDSNVPVQVSGLTGITAIAGGSWHSLALKNDGTVRAWGWNSSGQLGNGTNTDSNIPVQVNGLTSVSRIAAGGSQSLALRSDATVRAWGENSNGQLGNGTTTSSNVPVQPTALCPVVLPCTMPSQPASITGSAIPCSGSSQTYSVAAVTGATSYTWILPTGWSGTSTTNTISATVGTAGGNITVAAVNACGTSPVQTFTVGSVLSAPSATISQSGNVLTVAGSFTSYQWYFNGNPISGATSTAYTANQSGNYYIKVTGSNGCSGQSNTIGITVGIEEVSKDEKILLAPNPVKDMLFIVGKKSIGLISIYDGNGRKVFEDTFAANEAQVDVKHLPSGIYYLRTENQQRGLKLIKQ